MSVSVCVCVCVRAHCIRGVYVAYTTGLVFVQQLQPLLLRV